MNDDRDTRGQELSTSDGKARSGQVDGQHRGRVPGDGAADTEAAGFDGRSGALWPGSSSGAFATGPAGDGSRTVAGDTDGNGGAVPAAPRPRAHPVPSPHPAPPPP